MDVVGLIDRLPFEGEARERSGQVFDVLHEKNLVEYEDVDFGEDRARACEKRARRFHEWAMAKLGVR